MAMDLNVKRGFAFGTDINTVQVPEVLRKRVATGIDYLDGVWGGQGLTPSCVTLFTGAPGAGKTTMMLTMANGLAAGKHLVVFNTAEESLYQIKLHSERLNLRAPFKLGEETHVPTLLENCDKLRAQVPDKHFVLIVDSLQTLNDGKYGDFTNSKTPGRALEMITKWAKENNTIPIVIGQVGKDGKFKGENELRHEVDAHLELSIDLNKKSETFGLRVLQMSKNRFGGGGYQYFLGLEKGGFTIAAVSESDNG
jgi:DNA repair protein RadA/Sms